nr:caspase family protein [uncultured Cardiobacterium sp.]
MKNLIRSFCLLFLLPVFAAQAESARVALVIGNAAYESNALKNPVNDAELISDALKQVGFRVTTVKNANRGQMEEAIKQFGRELQPDSTALFYYAGHGVQHEGKNYLLPIGAIGSIQKPGQIDDRAISAAYVLGAMEDSRIKLVFLDACRDAPFTFSRSLSRGLAPMSKSGGTLISYATMPGTTAADGDSRNSPYARSLAKWMREPLKIEDILKQVGSDVERETGGKQSPEYTTAVRTDFFFTAPTTPTAGESAAAAPVVVAQDADVTQQDTIAILNEAVEARKKKDYDRARRLVQPLAEAGNDVAQTFLAVTYVDSKDYDMVRVWSEKAAAQGNGNAQVLLGALYKDGKGVKQDYTKAATWFEKAAAQGEKKSQFELGSLYYQGKGVKQDYTKARKWWEKAAAQGDDRAQGMLGVLYYEGSGVKQDYTKAHEWWEKAAAQRDKDAEEAL